jgi:mRNA-degrading endonuclease toxin of MazEF toxin-antitoxin module
VTAFKGGEIVLADWRGDALPKEPNKRRPAVVVEDSGLFAENYPNVILVPLSDDLGLVIRGLAVEISPTAENGCSKLCWAAAHLVAATSKRRVVATGSMVTVTELSAIRRLVAMALGAV